LKRQVVKTVKYPKIPYRTRRLWANTQLQRSVARGPRACPSSSTYLHV